MTNALENDTLYPYDYDSIKFSVIICLTWGIQLNILKGWFFRIVQVYAIGWTYVYKLRWHLFKLCYSFYMARYYHIAVKHKLLWSKCTSTSNIPIFIFLWFPKQLPVRVNFFFKNLMVWGSLRYFHFFIILAFISKYTRTHKDVQQNLCVHHYIIHTGSNILFWAPV